MYVWSKLSSAKWEDAWEERFHAAANTSLVITRFPNSQTIKVQVFCHRKENAETIQKMFGGTVRELKRQNWQALSARSLKPIAVRGGLTVCHTPEAAEGWKKKHPDHRVLCIPGEMAFGTGDHATTANCLRLLVDFAKNAPEGWCALDLGCGTGILALAAVLLGAKSAAGCDYDAAAVKIAKKNAAANKIKGVRFWSQDILEWEPDERYALVFANIFHDVLTASMGKIAAAAAPGGTVIVSGILTEQLENVQNAARAAKLKLAEPLIKGKWATFSATAPK
jgi:ribosomal protein L11 methyltransferase